MVEGILGDFSMVGDIDAFDGFGPGVCGLFVRVFWMDEGCICCVSYVRLVYAIDASYILHKLVRPDECMLTSPHPDHVSLHSFQALY